ncbi:MAG: hypothetical protein J6N93_00690 [Clostridia bacterium]|nr:hypothetical protein [Clostridia bacterium]
MNVIFIAVFTISVAVMAFIEPNAVVGAMTVGGRKALELTFSLTVIYAVWLGVSEVAEKAGVNKKIAKLLSPAVDKLFKNADEETKKHLSMNISANLLGLGGVQLSEGPRRGRAAAAEGSAARTRRVRRRRGEPRAETA